MSKLFYVTMLHVKEVAESACGACPGMFHVTTIHVKVAEGAGGACLGTFHVTILHVKVVAESACGVAGHSGTSGCHRAVA